MENDIYLDDSRYLNLVRELADLPRDPVTGIVDPDAIKIALGLIADIWPAHIRYINIMIDQ